MGHVLGENVQHLISGDLLSCHPYKSNASVDFWLKPQVKSMLAVNRRLSFSQLRLNLSATKLSHPLVLCCVTISQRTGESEML